MNRLNNNIHFILPIALASVLLTTFTRCSTSEGTAHEQKAEATPPTAEVVVAQKGILTSQLVMPGELISFQQVDLYAREASFVKKVYVDVGSEVSAGQLLVSLEAPELTSRLAAAQSRWKSQEALYTASKAAYERLLETSKTPGTISPNDLDQALARMNSDQAQLEAAKAAHHEVSNTLSYLSIRAPFGGVITARNVNPGAYVGPAGKGSENPLFTLQEQKNLRLVISVPEAYTAYLKALDDVTFTIKALPNQTFSAKVKRLAGALDTKLRAERVEMDVLNTGRQLLPGMIAEVTIPLKGRESTFILPRSAIVNSAERVFIIRVENSKAVWVDVTTGRTVDGKTEVFGALNEGDQLVKTASEEIRNGSALSVKKAATE